MVQLIDAQLMEIILAKRIENSANGIPPRLFYSLPKLDNEILYFDSKEHLEEVYDLVTDFVSMNNSENVTSLNILSRIEKEFNNYVSFNKMFEDKYDFDHNSFTDAEVTKIEKEDFINDEILKTFLNSNRLIGFGDKIYFYLNRGTFISFEKGRNNLIEIVKNYVSKEVINDKEENTNSSIDAVFIHTTGFNVESKDHHIDVHEKGIVVDQWDPDYLITYYTKIDQYDIPGNCVQSTKGLQIYLNRTVNEFGAGGGGYSEGVSYSSIDDSYLIVEWGDGTTDQYNNFMGQAVYHTYSGEGDYYPKTSLYFKVNGNWLLIEDGAGTNGIPLYFGIHGECSYSDIEKYDGVISGDWKMTCKLWVNDNILGNHIGAYTHGWKYVNGKWKRKISNINAQVDGVFRDGSCVATEHKTGSDTENQERVQVTKTKLFKKYKTHGNGDVKSHHNLVKNGININLGLSLNPC
ncbi:MAG: hypothetical protein HYR91_04545 [Flavobacteriia bacterium]|nr:hypothetical protein [Flavobacteriia bacterium]